MNLSRDGTKLKVGISFLFLLTGVFLIHLVIPRHDSLDLMACFFLAFAGYVLLIRSFRPEKPELILILTVLSRVPLFFNLPALSDDFYRFIWDGRLLVNGINPFSALPSYYLDYRVPGLDVSLFQKLNSPEYFTIYPPISQLIFWLSAQLGGFDVSTEVLWMRWVLMLFDVGNVWLLIILSRLYGLHIRKSVIYAFNPLVILELTGNLHYEGVMIFFLLLTILFFKKGHNELTAVAGSMAIAAKLVPIMFLPYFLKLRRRSIRFYAIIGLSTIVSFLPLISWELIEGMISSISLFFVKFEFNASIYYLARSLGYQWVGYNNIAVIGPALKALNVIVILIIVWRSVKLDWDVAKAFFWMYFSYLALSTTVHPWYVIPLLVLGIFTKYQLATIWSGLVFISYWGYYERGFEQLNWPLWLEYTPIYALVVYEIYGIKPQGVWSRN